MARRTTLKIVLEPSSGSRFQPTGFPDLGAAIFQKPAPDGGWTSCLLVESVQSMANHAEGLTWDYGANDQRAELKGLPFVRVEDSAGTFLSASRLEAHRLASAYVMNGTVGEVTGLEFLRQKLGVSLKGKDAKPLDRLALNRTVYNLDPLGLIHGVFFARNEWAWQPKIARALTIFVEAYDVQTAVSGGIKTDRVRSDASALVSGKSAGKSATTEGYGMVPHSRTEYTARDIVAHVNVDHEQIRSYGLGEPAVELLEALVDFELAHLFEEGLRLRTACDLVVKDVQGGELATTERAISRLGGAIAAAGFPPATLTTVVFGGR
jgi:CRISPR-associated protein Csb1